MHQIRRSAGEEVTKCLVTALVLSRLDYCTLRGCGKGYGWSLEFGVWFTFWVMVGIAFTVMVTVALTQTPLPLSDPFSTATHIPFIS